MPAKQNVSGGQASAIQFQNLVEFSDQVPVLTGKVLYREPQVVNDEIDDLHSLTPAFRSRHVPGEIKMTLKIPVDSAWLRGNILFEVDLDVVFSNGLAISFSGVTLKGDPVEKELTAGTTNELTFGFISATES